MPLTPPGDKPAVVSGVSFRAMITLERIGAKSWRLRAVRLLAAIPQRARRTLGPWSSRAVAFAIRPIPPQSVACTWRPQLAERYRAGTCLTWEAQRVERLIDNIGQPLDRECP